jgi:hypothetical protein
MQKQEFQITFRAAAIAGTVLLLASGCNKKADNSLNYKSAINSYYSAHPACLFPEPVKFPLQVATSDASKTEPYDALVDQRLLVRTNSEKTVLIISRQQNNYDLSNEGRQAWTADTSQPGYGNFCYGHRSVSSIDSTTPTTSNPGATTQVSYHYSVADAPSWATAAETKTAFPELQANLSGPQTATATLSNTSNGWQVSSTQDAAGSHAPVTAADGKVVQ